jgi:hypothetical protein
MATKAFTVVRFFAILALLGLFAGVAHAQFNGGVEGVVADPSGAGVPNVKVSLLNTATSISASTTTDASGNFQFLSLAPGDYTITVEAAGFAKEVVSVIIETKQTLNVPIGLKVKGVQASVEVTGEAPVLNTADSRNQMTLENQGVAELPIAGRNMVTLAVLAPGVTGLGTSTSGSPGSGVDNYSTETQVDASANGEGQMSNMWVVDGLDVTSGIRQGVLNLTPNPDSIQEATVQVNTFSAEYGRATGLQVVMTTKSGTDKFHGFADDYYNYENMFTRTHFSGNQYPPFHSNNISAGIGGPIIPHHQFFFFFDVEPLRSSLSVSNGGYTFADPAFAQWAATNFPGNVGSGLLNTYTPSNLSNVTVLQTAATYSPLGGCPSGSATIPVTSGVTIPCDLPVVDTGAFNTTAIRNGTQWFGRIDKYFANDRVYGSFYRTTLNYGSPTEISAFSPANNQNWEYGFQANWTHTFSPTTLNESAFGVSRVEGTLGSGAPVYSVPDVGVSGIAEGFGVGFAQGDFIQKNYHWRDVLTHIHGEHTLKFGYEGWYGQDIEPFQGPYSTPSFSFPNLIALAEDLPTSEVSAKYDPTTGQPTLWSWNAASTTWGVFAQDTWKIKPNLTLTLGLRWDDAGNPWTDSPTTVFGNFYLGPGSTFDEQVANGFAKATHHALNHSVDNLVSPSLGFAWDPTGKGEWVLRGGAGIYNNWLTQANVQEEFRGDPPGLFTPTFFQTGAVQPIFALGNSNKPPFGFTYPSLVGTSLCPTLGPLGCLDSQGGIVGAQIGVGGINPNLKSPRADIWAATLERRIGGKYVASIGYSGSHTYNLLGNNDQSGIVSYGVDINRFSGDLIQNESLVPTRLNQSFGQIAYSDNDRYANYEALVVDFRGRFAHSFFDASYTHSRSQDDAGNYPTANNPSQYYGPSPWDVPNRFSLTGNYQIPGMDGGQGVVGHLTSGWGISGTSIYQSGYPFTVFDGNSFQPVCAGTSSSSGVPAACPSFANPIIGLSPTSGDYNADGDNFDYPNVSGYAQGSSRQSFLTGIFPVSQITQPALGQEGNEKQNRFRNPNFAETDAAFYKDNKITEGLKLQLRVEFFNIFNRTNLGGVDDNFADSVIADGAQVGNFGKSTSQSLPRWWEIAARFTF